MSFEPPALGRPLTGWTPPSRPPRAGLSGRHCRLEPLDPAAHTESLHAAYSADSVGRMWAYLPYGPFENPEAYRGWISRVAPGEDPLFLAIVDPCSGRAVGVAAWLRIDPPNGVIEIGHLAFSPALQRTTAATEAIYLLIERAFALGYRRVEWKCDALNLPSRVAAERLGFVYEGIFRQAAVVKGRNRDTAWYAIIDADWPALRAGFERWLAPENFDADGRQKRSLRELQNA
ncbi:MAG: GNAT family protein [Verrucomicrobiota bacterium]